MGGDEDQLILNYARARSVHRQPPTTRMRLIYFVLYVIGAIVLSFLLTFSLVAIIIFRVM
jgi:hypothetical protein